MSRESSMILPALYVMSMHNNGLKTGQLRTELRNLLKVSNEQEKKLKGRPDFSFDQIIRNFKSHSSSKGNILFEKYATYVKRGYFQITEKGKEYLMDNLSSLTYLIENGFEVSDIANALETINNTKALLLNENVSEGDIKERKTKVRERSSKLRSAAIEHFTHNGIIACDCCGFEFKTFYGPIYGENTCIEIHHLKPIFLYNDEDMNLTIDKALQNLLPVCPNCHRVIHKNKITADAIEDFKNSFRSSFRQSTEIDN